MATLSDLAVEIAGDINGKRSIAPMVIGENVNLNDVTTPGEHSQQFTSWATPELNYPVGVACRVIVAANTARTQVTQFCIPFTVSVLEIWMRNYYNSWGAWERLPMARDLAGKADLTHPLLYDSGWRDVTSSLGSAVASDSTGKFYLRRRAGMVLVRFQSVKLAGGGTTNIAWSSLPVGFQPVGAGGGGEMFQVGTATRSGGTAYIMPDGAHLRLQGVRPTAWESPVTEVPAGHIVNGAFSFATADPVPTTLPGTPA